MFYRLIIVLTLLDLFTKRLAETLIKPNATVSFIPDWMSWKVIHNSGASFGLLAGHAYLISAAGIVMIFFIFYLYRKSEKRGYAMQASFALILGGAVGNLVDRITLGYVIDFIQFRWWPAIFNVADMEIRIGAFILLILFVTNRWNFNCSKSLKGATKVLSRWKSDF